MTGLMTGHRVHVLLYNGQTVSPITTRIAAARTAGIPVVGVSETMPPGRPSSSGSWPGACAGGALGR